MTETMERSNEDMVETEVEGPEEIEVAYAGTVEPAETAQPPPVALQRAETGLVAPAEPLVARQLSLKQLEYLALVAAKSNLYPGVKGAELMTKMVLAQELGLNPMVGCSHIFLVQGSISFSAQLQRALARRNGYELRVVERSATACTVALWRRGHELARVTYTIDQARQAGLVRSGPRGPGAWITNPDRMLFNACSRQVISEQCAHVLFWPDQDMRAILDDTQDDTQEEN
jgi:hypothetical protein